MCAYSGCMLVCSSGVVIGRNDIVVALAGIYICAPTRRLYKNFSIISPTIRILAQLRSRAKYFSFPYSLLLSSLKLIMIVRTRSDSRYLFGSWKYVYTYIQGIRILV